MGNLEPEVIVVVNALASKIIKNHTNKYQLTEELDEEYGCHYIELDGDSYPIFFSGMLTGKHALDVGSRERLKWQIDKIV